jgi:hypothetical protein
MLILISTSLTVIIVLAFVCWLMPEGQHGKVPGYVAMKVWQGQTHHPSTVLSTDAAEESDLQETG